MYIQKHFLNILVSKRARKTFYKYYWQTPEQALHDPGFRDVPGMVGVMRKTKVFCSCPACCGNPRRLGNGINNKTFREIKHLDDPDMLDILIPPFRQASLGQARLPTQFEEKGQENEFERIYFLD